MGVEGDIDRRTAKVHYGDEYTAIKFRFRPTALMVAVRDRCSICPLAGGICTAVGQTREVEIKVMGRATDQLSAAQCEIRGVVEYISF